MQDNMQKSEAFKQALKLVFEFEGGFSNHPKDPGGPTMLGITQATYDSWRKSQGLPSQDVSKISKEEAEEIYFSRFWRRLRLDELPYPLSVAVFDTAVNMGERTAIILLQMALRIHADGIIGPKTIEAASRANQEQLITYYLAERALRYARTKNLDVFGRGWYRRLIALARKL